ncbi:MAG: hypothetical protein ABSD03_09355 [Vulcanimicrobiaceae bacterium]|jgi:hypothetical protein
MKGAVWTDDDVTLREIYADLTIEDPLRAAFARLPHRSQGATEQRIYALQLPRQRRERLGLPPRGNVFRRPRPPEPEPELIEAKSAAAAPAPVRRRREGEPGRDRVPAFLVDEFRRWGVVT